MSGVIPPVSNVFESETYSVGLATAERVKFNYLQAADYFHQFLSLEDLLNALYTKLSLLDEYCGLHYEYKALEYSVSFGHKSQILLEYDLNYSEMDCGKIFFYRRSPSSEQKAKKVEAILLAASKALRNAVQYKRLELSERIDFDSQLPNKKSLLEALPTILAIGRRHQVSMSILMLRFDVPDDLLISPHKTLVIETRNQLIKEWLSKVVQGIKNSTRETDSVFRYDSNQIAIVLHAVKKEGQALVESRINDAWSEAGLCGEANIGFEMKSVYGAEGVDISVLIQRLSSIFTSDTT